MRCGAKPARSRCDGAPRPGVAAERPWVRGAGGCSRAHRATRSWSKAAGSICSCSSAPSIAPPPRWRTIRPHRRAREDRAVAVARCARRHRLLVVRAGGDRTAGGAASGRAELRVEAELALGRHAQVVGELQQLVAEHPLRERMWGQLMLALPRRPAGRCTGRVSSRARAAGGGGRHRARPRAAGTRVVDPGAGLVARARPCGDATGAAARGARARRPACAADSRRPRSADAWWARTGTSSSRSRSSAIQTTSVRRRAG